MRNAFVLVTFAQAGLSTHVWADQSGKSPVKVFILAGQSNMEGQGIIKARPNSRNRGKGTLEYLVKNPASAERYKHLVDKDGKWIERADVWIWYLGRKGKLTVGYGAKEALIGPELQFGHVLGNHLDNQVLLIKIAWGGRSLAKDFRPPSSGGEVGGAYSGLIRYVKDVLKNLKTHFPEYDGGGYEIAGFSWHQGWNDGCSADAVNQYEENLTNFIRDVRREFGVKDLPFVIANSGFAGWQQKIPRRLGIMKAQAAAAEYEEYKGNVICIETRDFYRPEEDSPTRFRYHWNHNAETFFLIGNGMGEAMVKLLDGVTPTFRIQAPFSKGSGQYAAVASLPGKSVFPIATSQSCPMSSTPLNALGSFRCSKSVMAWWGGARYSIIVAKGISCFSFLSCSMAWPLGKLWVRKVSVTPERKGRGDNGSSQ